MAGCHQTEEGKAYREASIECLEICEVVIDLNEERVLTSLRQVTVF